MRTFALAVALLALTAQVRADDVDPEPPGGSAVLRKLQGKWESVRRIVKGEEQAYTRASYHFEKDKVAYSLGKGKTKETTLRVDTKRPDLFALTHADSKFNAARYYFKVENGELYLVPAVFAKPKGKDGPDFSGKEAPVIIFKKTK
jgi:hypothetical protein